MATIYTRASKGSALTWAEGDANVTNLNNAKLENVVEDTTPQLGGNLDVNTHIITTSEEAGDIKIKAIADGYILIKDSTEDTGIALQTSNVSVVTTSASVTVFENTGTDAAVELVAPIVKIGTGTDNLIVEGTTVKSTTNDNIEIAPNGTGDVYLTADTVRVGDSNANATITTNGTGDLILNTNSGTNSGAITILDGADGDITLVPNGIGKVHFETSETRVGINNTNAKITTKGTGDLTLDTNSGTNSGSITIADGVNGNISITPNGTGSIVLDGLNWPQADGTADYVLKTNGSGQLSWVAQTADTNTTYSISAETATGGVNLRLTGSDAVTDDVKLAAGSNITLTRTDASTITIAATDTTGMTSFTVAGDTGSSQTIENANTLTISGGTGLSSVASATDTVTINLDDTAVSAGSYTLTSLTVDAQGRLTAASSASTTGSGNVVLATSPTLTTPTLGVASATSVNKVTITAPATSATLTIANGKTLTASNTLTFTGTDASSVAFGTGGTVAYTGGKLSQFAATTSSELLGVISDETGTGSLVFATSPTLTTPILGTPTSGNLTNCTVDGTNPIGYRDLPAVGSQSGSYSLLTSDVGKYVEVASGGSITIPNSTFAAGDVVVIVNNHTAAITITCTITDAYIAGTNTDKATVSLATRGIANIFFVSGTRCIITGNVS